MRPISGFSSCAARLRIHDARAALLVASPGSGPPGSPNLSPRVFGRASYNPLCPGRGGRVRLMATVLKTVIGASLSWVQIPAPPPHLFGEASGVSRYSKPDPSDRTSRFQRLTAVARAELS